MKECVICRIVSKAADAVVLYEDDMIMAFLDIAPIRPGHAHVVPRQHFDTFDELPPDLASRIIVLGQDIARRQKATYRVDRVAFVFTGNDIRHAHAHVIPMVEKTDITSARYIISPGELQWASDHLNTGRETLLGVKRALGF